MTTPEESALRARIAQPAAEGCERQAIDEDEDEYSHAAIYGAGPHTLTKEPIGTRYVLVSVRTLVDASDPADIEKVRALQDAIKGRAARPG